MSFNGEMKNKIQAINEQIESEKLAEIVKLSRRNIYTAIILSFLVPIGGYMYARRWLPLLGFLLGGFALTIALSAIEPEQDGSDTLVLWFLYGSIVAPFDNARAIARARERVSDLSQ